MKSSSGASKSMYYAERLPSASLSSYVNAFWCFRSRQHDHSFVHTVPPDGCLSLFYKRSSGWLGLTGPTPRPVRFSLGPEATHFFGVRFWPAASGPLLGLWPGDWRDHAGPLPADAWTRRVVEELERAGTEEQGAKRWESILEEHLAAAKPVDPAAVAAAFELMRARGQMRIESVARRVRLSERHLRRRFKKAVGLTPKEFARVQRIRASIVADVTGSADGRLRTSWVDSALAHGFSDQAHLTNEFRTMVGLTPHQMSRYVQNIEHRLAATAKSTRRKRD